MTVTYERYIIVLILVITGILFFLIRNDSRYYKWVNKYWFYKRSAVSKLSFSLQMLGYCVLLIALLDIKGKPEEVPFDIPDQKTIILIDSSASMLVEDVKPSRFDKALLVARDFVKKSLGHQISLVLFSDIQKQIVPFTDDINFLDSKLAALGEMNITRGGSNISQAIVEAISYLKQEFGNEKASGNLLIFTDGEESDAALSVTIPAGVNVGIVGVGTNYGGPIPIRNNKGKFVKYKKHQGERILSRLDESWLKKIGEDVASYRYWIALSYSIPTADIISFFHKNHQEKIKKGILYKSKVYTREIALAGVLLLLLGLVGRFFRTFYVAMLLFVCFSENTYAAGEQTILLERLKRGNIKRDSKLKLAELYLRDKKSDKAVVLYSEIINHPEKEENEVLYNFGTALIQTGKLVEGFDMYQLVRKRIVDSISKNDLELIKKIQDNTFLALNQENQKKKGKKEAKKNKKQEEKKKQEKKPSKIEKKKDDKKNKNKKKKKKKKNQKKDSSEKRKKANVKPPEKKARTLEEKEANLKNKRKLKKVPHVLDQLVKEDKNIQKKQVRTERPRQRGAKKKDW